MRAFLMAVMMAGCAWGQLTVGTNDTWRLKKGDIVVTNVTLSGVVWETNATYTATVARAASALQTSDTNGWTVSAHQAWITNRQANVTLTNFTASGYFRATDGMIHAYPAAGAFSTAYLHFGYSDGAFLYYDYADGRYIGEEYGFPVYGPLAYKFVIDPRDSSITYGSGTLAQKWLFPSEEKTNTVASQAWTRDYISTNAPSGGGNVASVFGRTGVVVAVSGDYTAEQVGAYPVNNPSNYVSAPLAWTPIVTGAGASVLTASVTTARSIYSFETAVPVTLTNDMSAVSLNGTTQIQWAVKIKYTDTNALSTVWANVTDWVGLYSSTPELTCTGEYEFAFWTIDGVKIYGRQVYPTPYPWVDGFLGTSAASSAMSSLLGSANLTTGVTNHWRMFLPNKNAVMVYRQSVNFATTTQNLELYLTMTDLASGNASAVLYTTGKTYFPANTKCTCSIIFTNTGAIAAYLPSTARIMRLNYARDAAGTGGNMYIGIPQVRLINELEAKTGWRP